MLSQVRAALPSLLELTTASKYASISASQVSTHLEKKAHMINLDSINSKLVETVTKLGSSILKSLEAASTEEELSEDFRKKDSEGVTTRSRTKESRVNVRDALLIGGGLAAIPTLAANYTLSKASDDIDAKMYAIPGLAAATVGAILAARSGLPTNTPADPNVANELESALNAREVLQTAAEEPENNEVAEELAKLSSVNTDHIAQLVVSILT